MQIARRNSWNRTRSKLRGRVRVRDQVRDWTQEHRAARGQAPEKNLWTTLYASTEWKRHLQRQQTRTTTGPRRSWTGTNTNTPRKPDPAILSVPVDFVQRVPEDVRRAGQRVSIQSEGHEALVCDGAQEGSNANELDEGTKDAQQRSVSRARDRRFSSSSGASSAQPPAPRVFGLRPKCRTNAASTAPNSAPSRPSASNTLSIYEVIRS